MTGKINDAILINDKDNVAVAIRNLTKDNAAITKGHSINCKINLKHDIPFGHKFTLIDILKGENIIKYGEVIGRASQDIKVGEHAHLHNVEGIRGRGDKQKEVR